MRHTGLRLTVAAALLGVALLVLSPVGAVATPGGTTSPSDFAQHHLVRAGSFSEIAEAVDSGGKVHLAAGNNQDVWYLTNRTGSWTARKVFVHTGSTFSGFLWGQPTIALDSHDRVHIAATRAPAGTEGSAGIFYVTDLGHARGVFGAPERIASNAFGEPQLQVYHGHLFLVAVKDWCCVGDGTVAMRTNKTGSWTQATIGAGQHPSFRITSDGFARVVYERGDTATGIYYAIAGSHIGNFGSHRLTGTNASDTGPLVALVHDKPQVTWRHSNNGAGSWKFTYAAGSGWHAFFTIPGSTANQTAAIAAPTSTFARIALAGTNVIDHYRCGSEPPISWCAETVASNVHAWTVAAAAGPGHTLHIVWIQSGDIWYAAEQIVGP